MNKKTWWISSAALGGVALVAVAGVTAVAVSAQVEHGSLEHQPGATLPAAPELLIAPTPGEINTEELKNTLADLARDPALGNVGVKVTDTTDQATLLDVHATTALRPASTTKLLTAAAALYELGEDDTITTEVVRGQSETGVVIKAAGDVWLTDEQLDDLAAQIGSAQSVGIDTSAWPEENNPTGWDDDNVDGGFVAPMLPAMINGGRIGATTGDVPRSHNPALDVAAALAQRLNADVVEGASAPQGAQVLASTHSPMLSERLGAMMDDSDNVMAEAIGREVATATGHPATFDGAVRATIESLQRAGLNTDGVTIHDNSGLSADNRITPELINSLVGTAATGDELRPLIATLPVGGASGTLADRYNGLDGKGWVRAKTGTLTNTSALAGVVTGHSGRTYSFAIISNDSSIEPARRAMDTLASALRDA